MLPRTSTSRSRMQPLNDKSVLPDDGQRTNPCVATHPLSLPGGLPMEVWMEIMEEYFNKDEWLTLCKTSRVFHQIARIFLYKRLDFDDRDGDPSGPLALFEKALQAQPELGTLICDLSLRVYPRHKRRFSPHALMSKIDQLPNLERLVLQESAVNAELRDAICSHPRLKVLEFDECILDESLLTAHSQDYSPRNSIVDLKFSMCECRPSVPAGLWGTFAPAGLRSLHLSTGGLPDSNAILSNIMASGNMLEKLTIHCIPSCIIQFLVSTPRLRHLVINTEFFGGGDPSILSSLPEDAIPLLEHYTGPAEASPIFVRSRPVYSLELVDMRGMDESKCATILNSLKQSSMPVTRLAFRFPCLFDTCWLPHLPITMRHLEICVNKKEDLEKLFLLELSHLADLCTIFIMPAASHTSLSREEMLKVSKNLPSLRGIVIWWNEIWRMTEQNVWVWEKFKI